MSGKKYYDVQKYNYLRRTMNFKMIHIVRYYKIDVNRLASNYDIQTKILHNKRACLKL